MLMDLYLREGAGSIKGEEKMMKIRTAAVEKERGDQSRTTKVAKRHTVKGLRYCGNPAKKNIGFMLNPWKHAQNRESDLICGEA
jgi:hypothetical protein